VIPDIATLEASFRPLLEKSGGFSPAERREALATMFRGHGYEWSLLCPACPDTRALILPAPWSLAPLAMADRFAELAVWETDPKRAELLNDFYRSLTLPVKMISAPLDQLVDHPDRYDVLVFEDSFAQLRGCGPKEVETWAAKLLAPGGQCCIVTASRFGRNVWRGNLKSFARELRRVFKQGYAVPSLNGLRRRMRRASLTRHRTYYFYPDHRKPREILSWNGTLPRHMRGGIYKLLDRLGFTEQVHDSFMMVAGEKEPASGLVDELLSHIEEELGLADRPAIHECRVQRTGVMLLFLDLGDRGEAVLRVPLHRRAELRMVANGDALETLHAGAPQIHSLAPQRLSSGSVGGMPYYLENKLTGTPAYDIIAGSRDERWILDEAFQFLKTFSHEQARYALADEEIRPKYYQRPLDIMREHFAELSEELDELGAFLDSSTKGQRIPSVWLHGDFNTKNVLVHPDERKITGVIDWDLLSETGLPLQDLLHFILSMHRRRRQIGIGEVVVRALEGGLLHPHEQSVVDRYCAQFDLQPELVKPMLLVYWARHVAPKSIKGGRVPGDEWSQQHVIEPLRKIRWLIKR
jgi:aminoglycoside phosphotransferase (APT) family kinase protein